jgi:glycosyltransferase involved in cell wall biosynthesis
VESLRIVIATIQVPFIRGGAESHAENLKNELIAAGHQCEIVSVPFKWYPPEKILDHILSCRLLDLSETNGQPIDLLIGLRFPAYLIPHDNKVLWIIHQYRTAYELWDSDYGDLIHYPQGRRIREFIHSVDTKTIPQAKAVYANSLNVSKRLKKYNGVDARPLYHPPPQAENFYCGEAEDYIFYPSRLNQIKRQELAIRALAKTKSKVRLFLAGSPDDENFFYHLKELAKELKITDRVSFLGAVSEKEKVDYYAGSTGVLFIPYDEDYGYVTLEAMLSGKAVITCSDSGGPLEFINNGENGFVVDPDPEAIAGVMDKLFIDKSETRKMGRAGRMKYDDMSISWKNVVEALLR